MSLFGNDAQSAGLLVIPLIATGMFGCSEAENPVIAVSARISDEISTVVIVEWETRDPAQSQVDFGVSTAFEHSTPLETTPVVSHRALLLGMKADTEIFFRITVVDGGDRVRTRTQSIRTRPLPSDLPDWKSVSGLGPEGYNIVPIINLNSRTVTVLDPDGNIVWYHREDRDLDVTRARFSVDGKSILYNAASISGSLSDNSEIVRVSMEGEFVESIPVPLLAHDFVEHPDGTLAAIVGEYRDGDDGQVLGNQIVEISRDGTMTTVFSTWNCFDPAQHDGDGSYGAWTFANALDFAPEEDAYYLGLHNFSSIVKIDRKTGTCPWVFGNTAETIAFAPGAPRFLNQHQFQVSGDRILVFDNSGALGDDSRVIEYQFDFTDSTASAVWQYVADPPVGTMVLGEPIRLDDGNTFINWSASGQMNLVAPDKTVLFQLNTIFGDAFGFNVLVSSLYGGGV